MTSSRPLSRKEISLFFFPLLLNVQLMSVSHSIINAALARQEEFITALAAFSVAMVLHLFIASPSYQNHTITIAMVRGRRSLRGTVVFILLTASCISAALALVAFTAVGDFVVGRIIGVTGAVAEGAREVLGILVFLPFFTGLRGLFQGLVMQERRTALVSVATGVRIAALFVFLALGIRWFSGAMLGAFALLGCVAVETVLMAAFASRCTIPRASEGEKGAWEIIRFAWPLAFSSCMQQSIPLLINAIISRLPDGTLALASFGVVRGFLFLLAGPMRNLQQVYLALVGTRDDYDVLVGFFRRVAAGMALLMILIAYPLNEIVLGEIMGLDAEMRRYIALPLVFCALFPLLYGAVNLLRGYFTANHLTGILGWCTTFKLGYVLACWGGLLLVPLPVPGIAMAIFLLISSEFLEAFYLRHKRDRLLAEG